MKKYVEVSRGKPLLYLDRPSYDSVGASSHMKVPLDIGYRLVGMWLVWKDDLGLYARVLFQMLCFVLRTRNGC